MSGLLLPLPLASLQQECEARAVPCVISTPVRGSSHPPFYRFLTLTLFVLKKHGLNWCRCEFGRFNCLQAKRGVVKICAQVGLYDALELCVFELMAMMRVEVIVFGVLWLWDARNSPQRSCKWW